MNDKELVIRQGSIDPSDSESIKIAMEPYPDHYVLMVMPGEIHACKIDTQSENNAKLKRGKI